MRAGNTGRGDQIRYCQSWLAPATAGLEIAQFPVVIKQRSTSGMAIASLVLGLFWVYWIGSLLGAGVGRHGAQGNATVRGRTGRWRPE